MEDANEQFRGSRRRLPASRRFRERRSSAAGSVLRGQHGHAGDGNLHINIIKGNISDENWITEVPKGIRELFELTVALKGTLSGEHGIGYVQREYMNVAFSEVHLTLMKQIKKAFDPNGILNPGKIFPTT